MFEEQAKSKMQQTLDHFKQELKNLRTNRANPGMVEGVIVEVYGAQMKLKEIANITTPQPRELLVTPYDTQSTKAIATSIEKNTSLQPILEGNSVRIKVPPMDQATRQDIVKQGRKKAEDAKIAIREIRRKINDTIKEKKASGELTEDAVKKEERDTQQFTDQFCKQIDEAFATKEKEIMAI